MSESLFSRVLLQNPYIFCAYFLLADRKSLYEFFSQLIGSIKIKIKLEF